MRVYYDTEFIEDGETIELISIGMVAEDGREYYAVNADMPVDRVREHDWLRENVWPHLPVVGLKKRLRYVGNGKHAVRVTDAGHLDPDSTLVRPRRLIRNEVRDFLQATPDVELWADYGAYDHVALCQLWGTMIALPKGVPMWTNDLRQEWRRLGCPELPEQADAQHDALADARHGKVMGEFLVSLGEGGRG